MNKGELIAAVATDTGLSKADSEKALNAVLDNIKKNVTDGVQLIGFGSFIVVERAARKGYNPRTREEMEIKASKSVKFKPGAAFKTAVN